METEENIPILAKLPEEKPKKVGWFVILLATVLIFDLFAYCSSWGEDLNLGVKIQIENNLGTLDVNF